MLLSVKYVYKMFPVHNKQVNKQINKQIECKKGVSNIYISIYMRYYDCFGLDASKFNSISKFQFALALALAHVTNTIYLYIKLVAKPSTM